eukprot:CAMPEP_0171171970 /NCGR_PEP_ID=MMETSP0790-20130122/9484_1 /TAXON_ID=2925 /ORGANISM="Alexandrium catenella, Strain OF101" /LENGTH=168 /DNA_ID=CAMNT_0011636825 /DNA_START=205 /DNA_END=708 /DNA_ORIENTATION=-
MGSTTVDATRECKATDGNAARPNPPSMVLLTIPPRYGQRFANSQPQGGETSEQMPAAPWRADALGAISAATEDSLLRRCKCTTECELGPRSSSCVLASSHALPLEPQGAVLVILKVGLLVLGLLLHEPAEAALVELLHLLNFALEDLDGERALADCLAPEGAVLVILE